VARPLQLTSKRLRLRPLCMADAAAVAAYRGQPEVARYQSWETFDVDDAVRLIESQANAELDTPDAWLQLAIILSAAELVIGDCGIHFLADDAGQVELGVTLSPAHQGQGLAGEALAAVLDHVFTVLRKHRVSAVTDAANGPAIRLFERLGFAREAHRVDSVWFKGAWGSELVFALSADEWQARSKTP
jgi:RimJ/RimL family protein N-acetyltransferase